VTIESSGTIKIVELFDFQGRLIRKIDLNSAIYKLDMSSVPRDLPDSGNYSGRGILYKKLSKTEVTSVRHTTNL